MREAFYDKKYGNVEVNYSKKLAKIKIYISLTGVLSVDIYKRISEKDLCKILDENTEDINNLANDFLKRNSYRNGQKICHGTYIYFVNNQADFKIVNSTNKVIVYLPTGFSQNSLMFHQKISKNVKKILTKKAKLYLKERLQILAKRHNFSYFKFRISHAKTRWGSCSSQKVISLNIALMKLDFDLIDYVILHELTHTVHLNHSKNFWNHLTSVLPNAKELEKNIKKHTPEL